MAARIAVPLIVCAALLAGAPAALAAPEIVAHRGGTYVDGVPAHAENTLPAFGQAAREGHVLELDVKLTRDGVPVVLHDATLDRTTTCSGPVAAITARQLVEGCRADVLGVTGLLSNPSGMPTQTVAQPQERVPTLRQVLQLARSAGARLVIEIKNYPVDQDFDASRRFADRVLDEIDRSLISRSRIVVQSFWPPDVLVARSRGFTTSLISLVAANHAFPETAATTGSAWLTPGWPVDPILMLRARLLGLRVMPYTLNREGDIRLAARLGVDAIITDDPARVARVLGR